MSVMIDRHLLLRSLDERHDVLVRQLDELNERIEQALVQSGSALSSRLPLPSMDSAAVGPSQFLQNSTGIR
jgi:hypothetical protein